jgi:hypothetical protein
MNALPDDYTHTRQRWQLFFKQTASRPALRAHRPDCGRGEWRRGENNTIHNLTAAFRGERHHARLESR